MSDLTAPAPVRRTATQGADEATMRELTAAHGEYVTHRAPTCVSPFLYVQPVIVRSGGATAIPSGPVSYTVWFVWTDTREPLDRRLGHGISTGANRPLANRLAVATEAGALFKSGVSVKRDVNGHSYVCGSAGVMGRYLNADLARLGH